MAAKIARGGLLTALALILGYVESLIPLSPGIPGVKPGLANIVVLSGLYYLPPQEVLAVSAARILLLGFLFGNSASIAYSLAGGILSFAVMLVLLRAGGFSPVGVSIGGAVSHNIGQLAVAACVLKSTSVFWYLPVLLPAGLVTGFLTGILTKRLLPVLRNHSGAA